MDNKGQSLVVFVLIMPAILLIIMVISDLGNLSVTQNKYEREIKSAIKYGLKHKDEENLNGKILSLLNYNIKEDKEVTINDSIEIRVLKKNKVVGLNFDREMDYIGYIQDGKIIIDRR